MSFAGGSAPPFPSHFSKLIEHDSAAVLATDDVFNPQPHLTTAELITHI